MLDSCSENSTARQVVAVWKNEADAAEHAVKHLLGFWLALMYRSRVLEVIGLLKRSDVLRAVPLSR